MSKYPHKVDELPTGEFYAILYPVSQTIPGDKRSKTVPGHGYPEHTVYSWSMEVYPTKELWEQEIIRLHKQTGFFKKEFKAIKATPAKIEVNISVV